MHPPSRDSSSALPGTEERVRAGSALPIMPSAEAPRRVARGPGAFSGGKALIKVGYACNDHCTFCHTLYVRDMDDTTDAIDRKIDRAAQLGYGMVVLSGGEPTARPELLRWAKRSAARGLDFGLVTNGRMLSYREVTDKLIEQRLKYVYLSLHGGSAKVHNACVRSDAFDQTFGAVPNLAGRGLDFTVNCVVTKTNLPHLRELVDLLAPFPDVLLKFSACEPKGGGDKLFDFIVPTISESAAGVADAVRYALDRGQRVAHGGYPLCLVPGLEDLYEDLRTHDFASMIEVWEDDYFPVDDLNKVQPEPCTDCGLRGACPGLFTGYAERWGHGELRPVPGPRSNSFNYTPRRSLRWPQGAPCPLLTTGVTPYDRGRHVLLRRGERMHLFETRTRDFADVEIAEVKRRWGQLYLDVSDKSAPDDFAADLRHLALVPECGSCPARDECTGCWAPVDEDVFTRDDARLRARLGELRGEVLDLGCGDGRYGDVLAPLAEAGQIRYRGVDPDPESLAALAARWPWAELTTGVAEDLDLEPRAYDHVLILRSWNHLAEPQAILQRLVQALRPGGTILVADNVAFGLLRTEDHARRAERGPAKFEHHRNHSAEEAAACFQGLPVELLAREDVGPSTSNQWVLHYRRTS